MNNFKDITGLSVESRVQSMTGFEPKKVDGEPKKVLHFTWEKSNSLSWVPKVDVCCRMKPCIDYVPEKDNTLSILNDNTVALRNGNGCDDVTEYTFSSVFGPNVDQKNFFNYWVFDKVLRFLNGSSEFLFVYGMTNAGKTYTIHGNQNNPGIIPRSLALVFNILSNKITSKCKYKPSRVFETHVLNEYYMEKEEKIRNYILSNWSNDEAQDDFKSHTHLTDGGQTLHNINNTTCSTLTKIFDSLKDDKIPSLNHGDVFYAIWITYCEIYNEAVYDLLTSHSANQKRFALKLSFDQNKNAYVKGLTHVFVQSAVEAYKVMSFGKNNLKIASNNLNRLSNRSHCIFTLKLMRLQNIEHPKTTVISSISFYDLADSDHLKKTLNVGDQLTEAKHINSSLLVFNKCLSVLRNNQKRGESRLVPFKESKLTQMFQTALTGNNINCGISIIVNVNSLPNVLEETKQVLFMSAIACSINKTKSTATSKLRPSFVVWINNQKNITQPKFNQMKDKENLDNSNDEKNVKIYTKEELDVQINKEQVKICNSLIAHFRKILENQNTFHKNQIKTIEKNKDEFYENKIKHLKAYYLEEICDQDKKLANPEFKGDVINDEENVKNKSVMENYEFRISELQQQKEELLTQFNELKGVYDLQQEDIITKNKEIDNYKTMLKEAADVYASQNNDLYNMTQKVDDMQREMDEKNLEIEILASSLEAKHSIITEIEINQDAYIAEATEKKIEHLNEKLEEILHRLKATIEKQKITLQKLTKKNKKSNKEKSELTKKYQSLKQLYKNMSQVQEVNVNDHLLLSEMPENDLNILKLHKRVKELEHGLSMFEELPTTSIKPETKSVSVLTDICNLNLPLSFDLEAKDKDNNSIKSIRPKRKYTTKATRASLDNKNSRNSKKDDYDLLEKLMESAIDKIPTSTKKRRLFDNSIIHRSQFNDSNNSCDSNLTESSILSPSLTVHQLSILRRKK